MSFRRNYDVTGKPWGPPAPNSSPTPPNTKPLANPASAKEYVQGPSIRELFHKLIKKNFMTLFLPQKPAIANEKPKNDPLH